MKALITVAGSKYDATINSCFAIVKRMRFVPQVVKIYYSERQQQRESAERAKTGIELILKHYGQKDQPIEVELIPFDEYRLDEFCALVAKDIASCFQRRLETAIDITCGKKIVSGIMLKMGSEHRNKVLHIFYVYVTRKAYFDRWFPLRPLPSQDVMDMLAL